MICRAKILRLKQHHKKSFRAPENRNSEETSHSITADLAGSDGSVSGAPHGSDSSKFSNVNTNKDKDNEEGFNEQNVTAHSMGFLPPRLPNSASNYSINNSRLSASSSNQSFASGLIKRYRKC